MKRVLVIAIFFIIINNIFAQGYTQSLGIRTSWISPGIEYRYYTSDSHSLRGILTVRNRGLQLNALTEFYQYDLFPFSYQLVFFYGAGLHAGYESWDGDVTFENNVRRSVTHSALLAGIDGIIGLEYLFYEAPVKVGLEVKPFLDILGRHGLNIVLPDFALTIKYLF
jgi:hypothetical protein